MKIGDKYQCLEDINNIFGQILFKSGEVYEILDFDSETVTLNHRLIGMEYMSFRISILEKFKKIN